MGEVRAALARLRERWRAIGEKGTLKLRFAPLDPERSFAEIAAA